MKKVIIYSIAFLSVLACTNKSVEKPEVVVEEGPVSRTVYLVRHAEKVEDGSDNDNPDLTAEGLERARSLATVLSDKNITKVLSTDFTRTKATAQPTAVVTRSAIELYDHKDFSTVDTYLNAFPRANFLIVGHSNSTPSLANHLLGEEKYEQLDHYEYDKVFIIEMEGGSTSSMIFTY